MATSIIGGGSPTPTPQTDENPRLLRLVAAVDDTLDATIAFTDLTQWIEGARDFIRTVRFYIEHYPEVQKVFLDADFRWNSPEWDDAESTGLNYLQIEISSRLHQLREDARDIGDPGTESPAGKGPQADAAARMGDAFNDGANAHHALQATLDEMRDEIQVRCSTHTQGLFEAAVASVAQLDRAMGRGLDAWGAR